MKITIQSKETSEGYSIDTIMKGEATTKELKAIIKSILKGIADSTDEEVVICALGEYAKERLGIKDE